MHSGVMRESQKYEEAKYLFISIRILVKQTDIRFVIYLPYANNNAFCLKVFSIFCLKPRIYILFEIMIFNGHFRAREGRVMAARRID